MKLARAEYDSKEDSTNAVKALGDLLARCQALLKALRESPASAGLTTEYISCVKEKESLMQKDVPNSQDHFEKMQKILQSCYSRICKHHLKADCKEWMKTQIDVLKASNKMTITPAWQFSDIKEVQEKLVSHQLCSLILMIF